MKQSKAATVSAILREMVSLTRKYYGKRVSAPYARAAKELHERYHLPGDTTYYDWLIARGSQKSFDKTIGKD